MVTIKEPGRDERTEIVIEDDEDHDGWGPIRPRRSSTPPVMHAAEDDRDTVPVQCAPHPDGVPDEG